MRIEHVSIWAKDIDNLKEFYKKYFGAHANEKYENPNKGFQSYFLIFDGGSRLEIMNRSGITGGMDDRMATFGYAHIAISVGSVQDVTDLTQRLESDGYEIASRPRYTGDGYFESAVLDPEGNYVEITAD